MDNWNNEQNQDMSVSGQFSGNPYQDQNQNTYDQNVYPQQNTAGSYDQTQVVYDQPSNGTGPYNAQPSNVAGAYNAQPSNAAGPYSTQPGGNAGYGQPQNNYASGYGQPYANYNQPSYSGPGYMPPEMEEPVGVGEWTGLLAIASFVPCIGLILMLVWAFGGADKKSKSNFCKAYLIIALIRLALYVLLFIIWGASIASAIENL